jgi:alkylated DNA repair dioxygenase AlkB
VCHTESVAHAAESLFEPDLPPGFLYRDEFVTRAEEASLADEIARIEFANFEMRGVVARRRVAFFGRSYDNRGASTPPLPDFLMPLRDRVAKWANLDPRSFAMALVNEYRPGAPIGWHRDAPQYDLVAGVSLLAACRMKFRPYVPAGAAAVKGGPRRTTHEVLWNRVRRT